MSTKILCLMFHRVNDPVSQCDPDQFAQYLKYLIHHFPITTPDLPLPRAPLAVMLTFDDAYFDFYDTVFPLLKYHRVPALLAVSTKYILDTTSVTSEQRLAVPYPQGMENDRYQQDAPFCTWQEITEMAHSPYVTMASHGHAHANFLDPATDLHEEIVVSKNILETRLNRKIHYLVYPYGKMNATIHQRVREHYRYGVRIGGAVNCGWDHRRGQLYRIDADLLWKQNRKIDRSFIRKLTTKYWLNRLRWK